MKAEKGFTRLTIDVSPELHKKLKVISVVSEKSMRDLVTEAIEEKIQQLGEKERQVLNQ